MKDEDGLELGPQPKPDDYIFKRYIDEAEKYRHEFAMRTDTVSEESISEAIYYLILAVKTLGYESFQSKKGRLTKGVTIMGYILFGKKVEIDRNLCHIRDETCSCQVCLEELEELKRNGDDIDIGYMKCIKFV